MCFKTYKLGTGVQSTSKKSTKASPAYYHTYITYVRVHYTRVRIDQMKDTYTYVHACMRRIICFTCVNTCVSPIQDKCTYMHGHMYSKTYKHCTCTHGCILQRKYMYINRWIHIDPPPPPQKKFTLTLSLASLRESVILAGKSQ